MQLCDFCKGNYSISNTTTQVPPISSSNSCYLCRDYLLPSKLDLLIASAKTSFPSGIKTFSVSTKIPKDWLVREEALWDRSSKITCSIKSYLNAYLVRRLSDLIDAESSSDGQVRVVFDFSSKSVSLEFEDLFIFGRYKKLIPGLSQSRWSCWDCQGRGCKECEGKGKNYVSIEEIMGEIFKAASGADNYFLHASGREDVDVTNSAGRPFVLELKAAKTHNLDLSALSNSVASGGQILIEDLLFVRRSDVELVSESHFDKTYLVKCETEGHFSSTDLEKILSLDGKMIAQETPNRVVHRRADLTRFRRVRKISVVKTDANELSLLVNAEAGTYIKELVSSDSGRTKPSISQLIGRPAKCTGLEVVEIDDQFLDFILLGRSKL
ncbi:tRNA pseudouridine(54/55) synthase Pus10 [Candidatus Micrarchaeota archaeon]|nr:tRNA pseudouridine(54/55) synthase Pus10 [Candidatus Micrarchaeota archaeon]